MMLMNRMMTAITVPLAALLLSGTACTSHDADPSEQIRILQRARNGLLAEIQSDRDDCRALATALAAEPAAYRNRLVDQCFEVASSVGAVLFDQIQDIDRQVDIARRARLTH